MATVLERRTCKATIVVVFAITVVALIYGGFFYIDSNETPIYRPAHASARSASI